MNDTLIPLARQLEQGLIHHRRRMAFATTKETIQTTKDEARHFYYFMANINAVEVLKSGWEIGASFDPFRLDHELKELFQQCHPIASTRPHPSIDVGMWMAAIDEKLNLIAGRILALIENDKHSHTTAHIEGETPRSVPGHKTKNAGQRAARLASRLDASANAETSRRLPGTIRA